MAADAVKPRRANDSEAHVQIQAHPEIEPGVVRHRRGVRITHFIGHKAAQVHLLVQRDVGRKADTVEVIEPPRLPACSTV